MATGVAAAAEGVLDINERISCDYQYIIKYTDENGNIITDGYGYIDPYTGSYIN